MDATDPLPNAVEAEKSILSLMMQGDAVHYLDQAAEQGLRSDDFHVPAHRMLFAILQDFRTREHPIELVGLVQALRDKGQLENVGGPAGVSSTYTAQPTGAHFNHHLNLVKAKATQRAAIEAHTKALNEMMTAEAHDVDARIADASKELQCIADRSLASIDDDLDASQAVKEVIDELEAQVRGAKAPLIETHLDNLNSLLRGGIGIGEITVVAARPSMGKTAFALNLMTKASTDGIAAHFVSIESSSVRLTSRMVGAGAGFPLAELCKESTKGQFQNVQASAESLKRKPFWVRKLHNATALDVARVIRRRHRQSGTQLVIVDYLQLLKADGPSERSDTRLKIDNALDVLCPLADQLGIALVILAQLSRAAEGVPGKELQLGYLKESSRIEQDADCVMMIGPGDYDPSSEKHRALTIKVPKNRDGDTSFARTQFHGPTTTFHQHFLG